MGALGGAGLAVSRFTAHRRESLELVRYLGSKDVQVKRSGVLAEPPTGSVSRPSAVTGKRYQEVTDAYIGAVHSVLTGERSAPDAGTALENELVRITGFKKGSPPGDSRPGTAR